MDTRSAKEVYKGRQMVGDPSSCTFPTAKVCMLQQNHGSFVGIKGDRICLVQSLAMVVDVFAREVVKEESKNQGEEAV